jgi:hypothetical protein
MQPTKHQGKMKKLPPEQASKWSTGKTLQNKTPNVLAF